MSCSLMCVLCVWVCFECSISEWFSKPCKHRCLDVSLVLRFDTKVDGHHEVVFPLGGKIPREVDIAGSGMPSKWPSMPTK